MQESELSYLKSIGAPELFDKLVSQLLDVKPGEPRTYLLEKLIAMKENSARISEFVDRARSLPQGKGYDLTDVTADSEIEKFADQLYSTLPTLAELKAAESTLYEIQDQMPNILLLALKCAISRRIVSDLPQPVHVTVVVPLHKDTINLQSKSENPKGQDAVRRKERQLEWLARGKDDFSWNVLYVDSRCPDGSGKMVDQKISSCKATNSSVAFVEEYLQGTQGKKKPVILEDVTISTPCDKSIAAHLGLHLAQENRPPSGKCAIAVLSNADLCADLRQLGVLIAPISSDDTRVAVATRFDAGGALCTQSSPEPHLSPNTKHAAEMTFCHFLRKQLLSNAVVGQGFDLACPLKAFNLDGFQDISSAGLKRRGPGYDLELVLLAASQGRQVIAMTPVVWVENSDDPMWATTHNVFNQQVVPILQIYADHGNKVAKVSGINTDIVQFAKSLSEGTFHKLIEGIRADLTQHYDLFNPHWSIDQLKKFCR